MYKKLLLITIFGVFCFSLSAQEINTDNEYRIVSGSFINYNNAEKRYNEILQRRLQVEIEQYTHKDRIYFRVLVGPSYSTKEEAKQANNALALEYSWIRGPDLAGTIVQRQTAVSDSPVLTQSTTHDAPIPVELEERYKNRRDPNMGLASGKILDATTGSGIPDVEVQVANTPQKTLSDTEGVW